MPLRIAVGADHAGFAYKKTIADHLALAGYHVTDFGTCATDSADYPDFAHPVATAVETAEADFGILVCGSGNGVAITANKHAGVRAGLAWTAEVAALVRQHNNANVLCLPARFTSVEQALECVEVFLRTDFEGGRHQRRVEKMGGVPLFRSYTLR